MAHKAKNKEDNPFREFDPKWADRVCYESHIGSHYQWNYKLGNAIVHKGTTGLLYHLKDRHGAFSFLRNDKERGLVVKIIDLRLMYKDQRDTICTHTWEEIQIMDELKGRFNTSKLMESFVVYKRDGSIPDAGDDFLDDDPVIFYLVMPMYEVISDGTKLHEKDAILLGIDICEALQALYDKDKIHRDVKPSNIFIDNGPSGQRYILGDFGIARPINNKELTGLGTPPYYPPEWAENGIITKNGDLYSLSVAIGRLLGGEFLLGGCANHEIVGRLNWKHFRVHKLACPALEDILKKGLVDHEHRYQQPKDMQADLRLLLAYIEKHGSVPAHMTLEELKQSHGLGPVRDLVKLAKDALMERDFHRAAKLCREGDPDRDPRLAALLAYSELHLLRKRQLPASRRTEIEQMLRNGYRQTESTAMDEGDPAGKKRLMIRAGAMKCILAVSRYETGDTEEFLQLLESAARFGSPMACYILGRGLFTGDLPFRKAESQGRSYLQNAATDGYSAAERFLRSGGSDARHTMSDILREL